jgi:HTH-type transcriptional regulator / antitoxin HipB
LTSYVYMLRLSPYIVITSLSPYNDMTAKALNSIRDVAAAARGRRQALGLSQSELAARARVSRQWISAFEAGKAGAEFGLVIRLLEALDLRLEVAERGSGAGDRPASQSSVDLDSLLDEHRRP